MDDRFTHETKYGRGSISKSTRKEIFTRDNYTCVYCKRRFMANELTIDHLVPLALGGYDEITNYVTACTECNNRKGHMKLLDFCESLGLPVEDLPIYGDPIIDNMNLPLSLRIIRKQIFLKYRKEEIKLSSKIAQKRLEKIYRREYWETVEGKKLEADFPSLPGHVRIMIPEILSIANSKDDFLLLLELAKSANTRNLINDRLSLATDILSQVLKIAKTTKDEALKKRLLQAISRYEKVRKK